MVKLKYCGVGIDDVFLNSKIELMMDIVEFTSYIRNNSIDFSYKPPMKISMPIDLSSF